MANTSIVLEDEPLICHSIYNGYIGINVHSKHWVTECAWFKVINHPLPFLHVSVERTLICDFRLVIVYRNIVVFSIWITLSSYFFFIFEIPLTLYMCILLLLNQKAVVIILVIEPPPPSFPPYWNNFFQLINENIHSIFHVLYVGCVACEFLFTMVIINIA